MALDEPPHTCLIGLQYQRPSSLGPALHPSTLNILPNSGLPKLDGSDPTPYRITAVTVKALQGKSSGSFSPKGSGGGARPFHR